MKYVLDASVAICWVIPRTLTSKAIRLRDEYQQQIHELIAPTVFLDEVAGALTKAERQKDIAVGQAAPLFSMVLNNPPGLIPHAPLVARAIDISSRTRSGYYDCLYVALAEREGCPLITSDQKSINNLAPHFPFLVPLAALPG
jgi:predicted nucleic acid-binding protein